MQQLAHGLELQAGFAPQPRTGLYGHLAPQAARFCRKVRFLGQNPKIGYQKFNDLQTAKLSQKQLCDRTREDAL